MKAKIQKTAKYVKRMNFDDLSPAERRVAIAKDVIAGLRAKRLLATNGIYCRINSDAGLRHVPAKAIPEKGKVELSDVLLKNVRQCKVCAQGAIFIAAVEKFNDFKVKVNDITYRGGTEYYDSSSGWVKCQGTAIHLNDFNDSDMLFRHVRKFYTKKQFNLIEAAFEGWCINKTYAKAAKYFETYPDPEERMIVIMRNIIRNKGNFIPE